MKKIILVAVWIFSFSASFTVEAQGIYPVSRYSPVTSSDFVGYACRYTYTGSCATTSSQVASYQQLHEVQSTNNFFSSANFNYGSGTVQAIFNYNTYFPELGAYARSDYAPLSAPNPNPKIYTGELSTVMDTNVAAVAKYRYTGTVPALLNISGYLDSIMDLKDDNPQLGHSRMTLGIFTSDDYSFAVDGLCPIGGFSNCGTSAVNRGHIEAGLNRSGRNFLALQYYVRPGDEFYLGATLDANVCCQGFVDSMHTLKMGFDDISNLELLAVPGAPAPNAVSVDEPPSVVLAISALVIWILFRSRNKIFYMSFGRFRGS